MKHLALYGPTASGKTKLSLEIAGAIPHISIVNFDSCQFLSYLPSLTMLPSPSSFTEHLFGINGVNDDKLTAGAFIQKVNYINQIDSNHKLFVGGTGFYLFCLLKGINGNSGSNIYSQEIDQNLKVKIHERSIEENYQLLSGLDPSHNLHPNDHYRIKNYLYFFLKHGYSIRDNSRNTPTITKENIFTIFLNPSKDWLWRNISERTAFYFDQMVREVNEFIKLYPNYQSNIIGYEEILRYISGLIDAKTSQELINIRTRQYAKSQRTFLKNKLPADLVLDEHYHLEDISKLAKLSIY